jgi:hypothetical protein
VPEVRDFNPDSGTQRLFPFEDDGAAFFVAPNQALTLATSTRLSARKVGNLHREELERVLHQTILRIHSIRALLGFNRGGVPIGKRRCRRLGSGFGDLPLKLVVLHAMAEHPRLTVLFNRRVGHRRLPPLGRDNAADDSWLSQSRDSDFMMGWVIEPRSSVNRNRSTLRHHQGGDEHAEGSGCCDGKTLW